MATITENFKLSKPELSDTADITVQNANWDVIDLELQKLYTTVESMGELSSAEGTANVGNLADGEEFVLNENGVPTKFIKLTNNYNNSGRTLVIRKHLLNGVPFSTATRPKDYAGGGLDVFCNQTYLSRLDATVIAQIIPVTIQYIDPDSLTLTSISRAGFSLSSAELDIVSSDGETPLAYFTGDRLKRIAHLNGVASRYWTRSTLTEGNNAYAYVVNTSGTWSEAFPTESVPVRPAFTLPSDLSVKTVILLSTGNMGGTATVSE